MLCSLDSWICVSLLYYLTLHSERRPNAGSKDESLGHETIVDSSFLRSYPQIYP